jgi:predicted enzyme related to lactoylglutathione lyase
MAVVSDTSIVWLPVTDIDQAVQFYTDLGLQAVNTDGDWAEVRAGQLRIGLNQGESPSGSGGAVIAFQPEGSLEDAVGQLKSDGVEIAGDISEHPWGRIASFKDPFGNDLQLYEPPQ